MRFAALGDWVQHRSVVHELAYHAGSSWGGFGQQVIWPGPKHLPAAASNYDVSRLGRAFGSFLFFSSFSPSNCRGIV